MGIVHKFSCTTKMVLLGDGVEFDIKKRARKGTDCYTHEVT